MSKKQPTTPPTVLTITLNADGTGSILTRRGELAHLSQFTYSGLSEIVEAIQHSATELITLENDPPVIDVSPSVNETPIESETQTALEDGLDGTPFASSDPSQTVLM